MPKTGALRLGLAALLALSACNDEAPTPPDLVLITVDRLAADRLGCFGGAPAAGGSICALGERGTLFAWTTTPGLGEAANAATLLTGLDHVRHGVRDDGHSFLSDPHETVAEALSRTGYATAAFVTSPRLNHSRRLDQGFDLFDDRLALRNAGEGGSAVDLSGLVQTWIAKAPSPWFVWIHADRDAGLYELDRLLSRLWQTLGDRSDGPGILFVALRGEEEPTAEVAGTGIGWRTHRIPLIWRPPPRLEGSATPTRVSHRLASLFDVATTLRGVSHVRPRLSDGADPVRPEGRDLRQLALPRPAGDSPEERFVLLETSAPNSEVGLATRSHLYRRRSSPLDGSARPVPTDSLRTLQARYASLPRLGPLQSPSPRDAAFSPGAWREDVLSAESPVPRLEFHLARRLARPSAEKAE